MFDFWLGFGGGVCGFSYEGGCILLGGWMVFLGGGCIIVWFGFLVVAHRENDSVMINFFKLNYVM